jgi:ABC-type enterochelin transport system ATPase subunit
VLLAVIDPIFGVILVAIIGPTGAYLVTARKMSGKIVNSDAEQLWAESKAIRDWSGARIAASDKEISELRDALRDVLKRHTLVEDENAQLKQEIAELKREQTS